MFTRNSTDSKGIHWARSSTCGTLSIYRCAMAIVSAVCFSVKQIHSSEWRTASLRFEEPPGSRRKHWCRASTLTVSESSELNGSVVRYTTMCTAGVFQPALTGQDAQLHGGNLLASLRGRHSAVSVFFLSFLSSWNDPH